MNLGPSRDHIQALLLTRSLQLALQKCCSSVQNQYYARCIVRSYNLIDHSMKNACPGHIEAGTASGPCGSAPQTGSEAETAVQALTEPVRIKFLSRIQRPYPGLHKLAR